MAAQCDSLSGYLQQSDQGSNSECSIDSPVPGSEDDLSGPHALPDPEWTEERFRVDRKKLEIMLLAAAGGRVNGGEDFFQKVMDETKTQIAWPSKLKIGAKSKKDPHIKVCGKRDNVREAKDRIMSVLDTKTNRVTLKMDVSHTEHSHVIGKGGNNIKKVMEDTGCHIHFPDSNRNNQAEKSNQVSIAGQPGGVEAARAKIRELLPLVLLFELPAIVQPDPGSPTVQHISQTYNLTVSFKPPTRLYGTTGVVRGSQNNSSAVKRGTAMLLEHLAGSLASAISVSTHLDIAPQHHLFMMGRNGSNIKHITQRTGAQIHFPDPNSPQKKSTVYIQGTIESVCLARQYLMGCLPLVLMFDIKEDIEVEPQCITALMEQLDVFISIKPKPKQPSKSVIVKSVERNAVNMYEARKFLLGLESNGVSSAMSPSTNSPTLICPVGLDILASAGLGLSSLGFLGASVPHSLSSSPAPNSVLNSLNSSMSPMQNPIPSTPSPSSSLWPSSLTSTQGFSSQLMMHPVAQATLSSILLSGVQGYTQNTPSPPPGLTPIDKQTNGVPDCSKGPCTINGHVKNPGSVYGRMSSASLADTVLNPNQCDSVQEASGHNPSEPRSSKSNQDEGSDTFVEVGMPRSPSHSANGNELKQMLASCKTSGKRQAVELLQGTKNSHLQYVCPELHSDCLLSDPESSASDSPVTDKRAPGSERAAERAAQQNERDRIRLAPHSSFANMQGQLEALEYEQKKLLATKAMLKKPVVTEVRTPTNTWSGLGFSKSMPAETIKELRRANHVPYKPTMSTTYEVNSDYEGSPLSLSRSGSREGVGNGSDSDNWRDRNVGGNGLPSHAEFPVSVCSPKRKQNKSAAEHYLSSSNYMDCISSITGSNGCSLQSSLKGSDLPELFSKLGLGKYTDVFQQQEIDLQTFLTLTDQDLKELGITTFGARRKMLLAISGVNDYELNKNRRKLFEAPIRSSFLEGGASGRLSRQFHADMASVSGRW
ncbi:protein bicaudal C homolog 1-A-like isoform X2 [Salvelinus fontinalis]|uniref:protein bicaudal C homolog 1-A-like isoform X2 n=1 Tax=Salvelinus fontinalis TaxID=8038 RepID=UPI002484DD39|nr:protein bicaudal C homolog 1-A-like isoform X2 [Salvelinus fontinalis]